MFKKNVLFVLSALVLLWACGGGESETLKEINLLPFGMSISVMAPADTVIQGGTIGDMGDVLINSKDSNSTYDVQIYSFPASVIDVPAIVKEGKELIQADSSFTKFVEEVPAGFVYEYDIDGVIGFDFRYFKIQGSTQYTFQTGLGKFHTEAATKNMFKAIRKD